MSFAPTGTLQPGRRRTARVGALDAFGCTLVMMMTTAAAYYVLALLLAALVEQLSAVEALSRAAWLSFHPAVLAGLALSCIQG